MKKLVLLFMFVFSLYGKDIIIASNSTFLFEYGKNICFVQKRNMGYAMKKAYERGDLKVVGTKLIGRANFSDQRYSGIPSFLTEEESSEELIYRKKNKKIT